MKKWIYLVLTCLVACRPQPVELESFHLKIEGIHLKVPSKYRPYLCETLYRAERTQCNKELEKFAANPPGWDVSDLYFLEQDFNTFERYRHPDDQQLSDPVRIDLGPASGLSKDRYLPNFPKAWAPGNRDIKNDAYGLSAYKSVSRDDINYRYQLDDGAVLFITCKNFNLPNPFCEVSTHWRGLALRYKFTHRHLSEWRVTQERLIKVLDSFVYAYN